MFDLPLPVLLACSALLLAVVALWLPRSRLVSPLLFMIAVAAGLWADVLSGVVLVSIFLFGLASVVAEGRVGIPSGFWRLPATVAVIILGLAFGLHVIPGFQNVPLLQDAQISDAAPPFRQYFNFDKAVVGLILLWTYPGLIRSGREWRTALRTGAPYAVATILVVVTLALASGFVKFDPKLTSLFIPWAVVNLLVTCVAEEAFFRGFLQRHLTGWLPGRMRPQLSATVICGVAFGAAHIGGGLTYSLLASVAGIGYGWIYVKTGRIEASILTHFGLNVIHFLLLTYPYYRAPVS